MSVATITGKGQVTVPVDIRNRLDLRPGTKLDFYAQPDGSIRAIPRRRTLNDLYGAMPRRKVDVRTTAKDELTRCLIRDDEHIRADR